jgi:hypothetical protein
MARKKNNAKSAGALEAAARLAHAHLGSPVVKDAYDAMVERQRSAWKTKRTPAEAREANRASIRAWYVNQAMQARRDGGSVAYEDVCKTMVEKGIVRPTQDERRAWSLREQVKVQVIVPAPKGPRGLKFTNRKKLREAVLAEVGFGIGWSFSEEGDLIGKEAAQIVNRLRAAIDEAVAYVDSPDDLERRNGLRDDAAEFLRGWVWKAKGAGASLTFVPRVPIGNDLARLIDWWWVHPQEELRPKTPREMAFIALRAGYWPQVGMTKHPTVADVIAMVCKGVRQIRNGH